MSTAATHKVRICPECHADNAPAAQKCWVCKGSLENATDVIIAELMADPAARSKLWPAWIGAIVVLVVSGLAIIALSAQAPGLAALFAIVWVIGLIALLLAKPMFRTTLADSVGQVGKPPVNYYAPPSAASAQGSFPKSKSGWELVREVLLILAVTGLIVVAAVVALCVACFAIVMASFSGGNFH